MTIHILEPHGSGGVYNHAVWVAEALAAAGEEVVLHTATDREFDGVGYRVCPCTNWHRGRGALQRRPLIVATFVLLTLPHLTRSLRPRDLLHIQGLFRMPLGYLPLLIAKVRSVSTVFSPHNTFSRQGSAVELFFLRRLACRADRVIAFSETDAVRLAAWGVEPHVVKLGMHWTPPSRDAVDRWRRRMQSAGPGRILLVAGQLRPDKQPWLVVEAAAILGSTVALVGKDLGGLGPALARADELGVAAFVEDRYLDEEELAAAIGAADVLMCPYTVASASGVLVFAQRAGVPSVASDVGGLAEYATVVVSATTAAELAEAVLRLDGIPLRETTHDDCGLRDEYVRLHRL